MNLRKKFSGQFIIISMFLMFISISMITGSIFQLVKMGEYREEKASLQKQLQNTKVEISKLEKESNSGENLEKTVRQRLNMVKPGEIIYIDIGKNSN